MTPRQLKAWGLGISGGLSIGAAFIIGFTAVTPDFLTTILTIAGIVLPMLGIKISKPEIE